jgi:EgtB-related family protein
VNQFIGKKEGEQWFERHVNGWSMMEMHAPVRHVSALDAEHFCAAQGLRLPTEAQLTALLLSNPQNWQCSKLWEWTSSVFEPFDGFSPDPYQDYSKPWFDGQHRVLKGWSPITSTELRRPQFRNFYLPTRSDPFCGFRTCLL